MNLDSTKRKRALGLRDRVREVKSEAILAAAEEVFVEEGIYAARMDGIAARAGMAVGTLYNHFEDRSALLEALIAARRDALVAQLDAVLAAHPPQKDFPALVRAFLKAWLDYLSEHGKLYVVILQAEGCLGLGRLQAESVRMLEAKAQEVIKRGLAARALKTRDAKLYPALLMGLVRSVLVQRANAGGTAPAVSLEALAESLASFFLTGAGVLS